MKFTTHSPIWPSLARVRENLKDVRRRRRRRRRRYIELANNASLLIPARRTRT